LDSTQWGFTSGYGYYFDVTTLADVKISGIGVHGFSGSVQTIQVWTKVNTYVGFENNPEEWELIQEVSVRAAGFARIGDLPDFAVPLSFSVNTRHAFRIVSDQNILYGRSATQKQIEEAGDGILSILTGDMTFDPGSFPPIDSSVAFAWNGELRYCQLSAPINIPSAFPSSIPTKSPSLVFLCTPTLLDSTQWGFTSGYGYYFDVTTLADVKISGIGVHGFSGSVQTIQVWTKVNTYVGFENNPEEWELIQEVSVRAAGFARIGDLPDFAVPLSFSVNTRHAFRIVSDQNILYGRSATQKQIEEAGDGILSILTGDMTFDPGSFPPIDSSVAFAWNGQLRYCQTSESATPPSISPTATIAPTFMEDGVFTTPSEFMGISGLYGNYFDVTSARDLNIIGLSVHTFSNLREVKVFTKPGSYDGFETDADSWTLIQTVTNQPSSGFMQITVLPLFADKILMSPGDRRAFLVVNIDRDLLSRPFNPNGVGFAGDQYIRIYSGPVSNRAEVFSSYGGAYSFNGAVQYQYNGRIL